MSDITTVDGVLMIGKLMDMWPRDDNPTFVEVSSAEADDILKTIDYKLSTYNNCSAIVVRDQTIGYVKSTHHGYVYNPEITHPPSRVKLCLSFLQSINYEPCQEPK